MKKIVSAAMAASMLIALVACTSVNQKRKTCEEDCAVNKKACYERAKDKTGHTDAKKKKRCDVDAKACTNDCARKFK